MKNCIIVLYSCEVRRLHKSVDLSLGRKFKLLALFNDRNHAQQNMDAEDEGLIFDNRMAMIDFVIKKMSGGHEKKIMLVDSHCFNKCLDESSNSASLMDNMLKMGELVELSEGQKSFWQRLF